MNNHLARGPVKSNQRRTVEMRDEVLSAVGAQDTDTNEYQVSDLDGAEFYWQKDQRDVDAVFRPRIDNPFPQQPLTT